MASSEKARRVRQRWGATLCAWLIIVTAPAHATFGEDVAVLLAQLEQQLQLVSNAIATVQNLVQTVQHLTTVVGNTGKVIKKATSKGGLKMIYDDLADGQGGLNGVLNAASNVTGLAQSTIRDLDVIGDAVWDDWYKWQSSPNASLCAGKRPEECSLVWSEQIRGASQALRQYDTSRLRSRQSMAQAFKGFRKLYESHKQAMEAAQDAQQEDGVLGAVQMSTRMQAHAMTAQVKMAEMAAISANIDADRDTREAAEREYQRALTQQHMDSLGEIRKDPPVEVGWNIGAEQWQ